MQPEEIVDDRDDSSCFHIHLDVCAFFDIQITGKGNCQNRRKGLTNSRVLGRKKRRKRTRRKDVKPPDQLCYLGKRHKEEKKKKDDIFNSLHMIPQLI